MTRLIELCSLEGHADRVWHVSWHPAKPLLVSCSGDKTIRVWAPRNTKGNVAFSHDSLQSITSSPDKGQPNLSSNWHCISTADDFSTRTVRCVEWSPCGKFLAAASFDSNVTIFQVEGQGISSDNEEMEYPIGSVKLVPTITLEGHENEVKSVAWSASGSLLATCSRDKSVWIWEAIDDGSDFDCIAVLHGHDQDVKSVVWHPSREILVSVSYDDTIRIWGEADDDWECLETVEGHMSTVWDASFSSCGKYLSTGSDDKTVRIWATQNVEGSHIYEAITLRPVAVLQQHTHTVLSTHWSPFSASFDEDPTEDAPFQFPNRILASAGSDDSICVYEEEKQPGGLPSTFSRIVHQEKSHLGEVNCVRWNSRFPYLLASAGDDGLVKVWTLAHPSA